MSPVPAGNRPFPTLSPQSLYRCLAPYPVAFLRCSYPLLPEGLRPHLREQRFGTPNYRRNATSTTELISGLQSFHYVQAPILARPSGCTHHWTSKCPGRPSRLHTPRIARMVTHSEMWHRYVPESGNWHDGTFTRWIAALSAAPNLRCHKNLL